MKTHRISLLLGVVRSFSLLMLLLLTLPVVTQAQFDYETDNGTLAITGYTGPGGEVAIPEFINGLPVNSIGHNAFSGCSSLTSITIPASVTSIGHEAFSLCRGLTSVIIPSSVTSIGREAFYSCTNLTGITVDVLNSVYSSVNGVLFDRSQTTLIQYPAGKAGAEYTIPNGVTSIGEWAFGDCWSLTTVTIPTSVTSIGRGAFGDCTSLTSITIPDSVTSIEDGAFSGGNGLTSVTIGNSVTVIGNGAFSRCTSLTSITIPNSVTSIGCLAFSSCGLTGITIPHSVTNWGVVNRWPSDWWGSFAFDECQNLTNIRFENDFRVIPSGLFFRCPSLANVTIPNTVTSIGERAFFGCHSLASVSIPDTVTSIGRGAFGDCTSLLGVYWAGDAPKIPDGGIFGLWSDEFGDFIQGPTIVYHLPGTTGWDTSFAGVPTALWKPVIQSNDASFGVHTNKFGFTVTWASDKVVIIEASTTLGPPTWSPVSTNTLTGGTSYFSDSDSVKYPNRFYRVRSP